MKTLFAIIFSFNSTVTIAQNKQCDFPLAARNMNMSALVDSLELIHLKTSNNKRSIPRFIKRTLNCWTDKFDIANPGQKYQSADVAHWRIKPLPLRQLTYLGLNDQYLILAYKKGGRGASEHLLVFKFANKKILEFWSIGFAEISSKEEVIYYLRNYSHILKSNELNL